MLDVINKATLKTDTHRPVPVSYTHLLDSSKFNRRGFNQVLPIEKIDIIITDDAVSEVDKLALQKTRVKLITV